MRRKLGQHFLIDRLSIERIIEIAGATTGDRVVEIGPGPGSLTRLLAESAGALVAIEYDGELARQLRHTFAGDAHVRILHADARTICYAALFPADSGPERPDNGLKIVANLPYYAAVPILLTIFRDAAAIDSCTLMFQQEVAERLAAGPGSKAYGLLSVTAQYYSTVRYCFSLPPRAFRPPPKVTSAVVHLRVSPQPNVVVTDEDLFFHLVRGAFQSRRKTLKNALTAYRADLFPSGLLHQAFSDLHLKENVRGEALALEEFSELSNYCARFQTNTHR